MAHPRFTDRYVVAVALVAPLLVAGEAGAEPASTASVGTVHPPIVLTEPSEPTDAPSDTLPKRSTGSRAQLHEGLYLRLATGVGGLWAREELSRASGPTASRSVDAPAMGFNFAVGAAVTDGFVLGATVLGSIAPNASSDWDGAGGTAPRRYGMFGILADGYPDPHGGFHVGGALGLGSIDRNDTNSARWGHMGDGGGAGMATGFALLGMSGYEWWIGREWQMGLLGIAAYSPRLMSGDAASSSASSGAFDAAALSTSLMLSATYN